MKPLQSRHLCVVFTFLHLCCTYFPWVSFGSCPKGKPFRLQAFEKSVTAHFVCCWLQWLQSASLDSSSRGSQTWTCQELEASSTFDRLAWNSITKFTALAFSLFGLSLTLMHTPLITPPSRLLIMRGGALHWGPSSSFQLLSRNLELIMNSFEENFLFSQ